MVAGVVFSEVTRKHSCVALPLVAPTHPERPLSQVLMLPLLTLPPEHSSFRFVFRVPPVPSSVAKFCETVKHSVTHLFACLCVPV